MRALLSIVLLTSLTATAAAQELSEADRRTAQNHFERGSLAFDQGDYTVAVAEFRAAYALTHHADLLYNIYTARERNGDLAEAAEALEGYLRDSAPEAERREALELRLERLRLRIKRAQLESATATAETTREREAAATELGVEQEGRIGAEERAAREHDARIGRERSAHETSDALFLAGAVVMAAGGLGIVSFAVFAGLSEAEDQSLAGSCGRDVGRICYDEDAAALRAFNTVADASLIAGVSFAAIGAAIVLIGESLRPSADVSDESSAQAWVRPLVSPTGAGAMVGGTW